MQFSDKIFLIISTLAALLGCVADVCLLYQPEAVYHTMDYQFLTKMSMETILIGHYLGVLVIPFEMFGVWVLAKQFQKLSKRAPMLICSVVAYMLALGLVYHGAIVFVAEILQGSQDSVAAIEKIKHYFDPLGTFLAITFSILSVLFIYFVYNRRTSLPRWIILFNPAFTYLILILLYIFVPTVGRLLIVAGFNFATAVFFVALFFALRGSKEVESS